MIKIFTVEDFEKFEKKLLSHIDSIKNHKNYISKNECFEIFGIKERTLTELRSNREITFSKIGNSCVYEYNSILQYLDKKAIKAIA